MIKINSYGLCGKEWEQITNFDSLFVFLIDFLDLAQRQRHKNEKNIPAIKSGNQAPCGTFLKLATTIQTPRNENQ